MGPGKRAGEFAHGVRQLRRDGLELLRHAIHALRRGLHAVDRIEHGLPVVGRQQRIDRRRCLFELMYQVVAAPLQFVHKTRAQSQLRDVLLGRRQQRSVMPVVVQLYEGQPRNPLIAQRGERRPGHRRAFVHENADQNLPRRARVELDRLDLPDGQTAIPHGGFRIESGHVGVRDQIVGKAHTIVAIEPVHRRGDSGKQHQREEARHESVRFIFHRRVTPKSWRAAPQATRATRVCRVHRGRSCG